MILQSRDGNFSGRDNRQDTWHGCYPSNISGAKKHISQQNEVCEVWKVGMQHKKCQSVIQQSSTVGIVYVKLGVNSC